MADIQISLADLVLHVKDVKRAVSFYRHALELAVQGEPTDEQAWLWIGEQGHRNVWDCTKERCPM